MILLRDQTTAGIQRCNREYQLLLIYSSLVFLPTSSAVPGSNISFSNLPAVSALCSSLVSALTDRGGICFNLSVESSPPHLLKGFPFKLLLFHSQSDRLFSRQRSPFILAFNV